MKAFITFLAFVFLFCENSYAQPANDDPCSAITIPVAAADLLGNICMPATTYSWTNATLTAATPNPSCGASVPANIRDVWYKMVVPASGKIQLSMKSTSTNYLSLYSGSSCSNTIGFIESACYAYAGTNTVRSTIFSGLAVGTTVYLRIMRTTTVATPSGSMELCAAESVTVPTVDNSTKIGIGTSSPLAKLDIAGTTIIRDSLLVNGKIRTSAVVEAMGQDGNITNVGSVYSSPWINSSSAQRDTTIDGTCYKIRHIDAPMLTNEILSTKLVTVYFQVGSIGQFMLPYLTDAGGATNQVNCFLKEGIIYVYRHTLNSCRFTSAVPASYTGEPVMIALPSSLQYRYVIHN